MKALKFAVWLLFPIIGVACIFFPIQMTGILPVVVGGAMILTGAVHFLSIIVSAVRRESISAKPDISYVALVLGIIIVLPQTSSLTLIGTVWGLYGIWESAISLHEAISAISRRESPLGHFCAAAFRLGVALILLLDPSSHFAEHVIILGFDILVDTCKGPDSEKLRLAGEAFELIKNDAADVSRMRRGSARPRMHMGDNQPAAPDGAGNLPERAQTAEAASDVGGEDAEKAARICPLYDSVACRCRFADDNSGEHHCQGAKAG